MNRASRFGGVIAAVAAVTFAASASAETVGPVTDELGVVKIEAGDPIEIGGYASSSGPDTSQGIIELRGAELAIRDFGQINGFDVKFVTEDAQCTAEGGQTAATKLAGDAQIVAVVGPSCSSGARVGAPILWNVGIPSIATGATAPNLTAPDRAPGLHGFLRAIANDSVSSALGAEYAVNGLKAKTAATIHDGSPFSEQSARGFEAEFKARGGTITAAEAISPSDTDMRPVLTRIASNPPDVLFIPVFTASVGFIQRQMAEIPALKKYVTIGNEGVFAASVMEAAGPSIVGFRLFASSVDAFSDRFPAFLKAYETEYGESPAGGFSAYGYDAALVILSAIKQVAKADGDGNLYIGRKALRDAMFATKDLQGLTGALTCTKDGDCGVPAYVIYEFVDADPASFKPGTNPKQVYP